MRFFIAVNIGAFDIGLPSPCARRIICVSSKPTTAFPQETSQRADAIAGIADRSSRPQDSCHPVGNGTAIRHELSSVDSSHPFVLKTIHQTVDFRVHFCRALSRIGRLKIKSAVCGALQVSPYSKGHGAQRMTRWDRWRIRYSLFLDSSRTGPLRAFQLTLADWLVERRLTHRGKSARRGRQSDRETYCHGQLTGSNPQETSTCSPATVFKR